VHVVDEPCREEVADRRGTSADPYVQAVRSLAGSLACLVVPPSISIDGRG
jgi:hypothetical protein